VVDAKWKSKERRYYRAYIVNCDKKPQKYGVYFPEDSAPRPDTPVEDIREVKHSSPTGFWTKDLDSFQGRQFHNEKGDFKIVNMELDSCKFKCEPLSGGRNKPHQYFDFGKTIHAIKLEEEKQREA
jgi:hypothetical protein